MQLLFGKKRLFKAGKLLLCFLFIHFVTQVNATDDVEQVSVFRGSHGEIVLNAERETIDEHFYDPIWYARIKDASKDVYQNIIALKVNELDNVFIPEDFTFSVSFRVFWTDKAGAEHESDDTVKLTVSYKLGEGTKYDARSSIVFDNARKVRIVIEHVEGLTNADAAMKVITLENRMRIRRDFNFLGTGHTVNPGAFSDNEFALNWSGGKSSGHTHYDLEWAWIDLHVQGEYRNGVNFDGNLVFKNNASRVTIPVDVTNDPSIPYYKIPMFYDDSGYLVYRVRPLQYAEDGNIYEGEWSTPQEYFYTGFEKELNWQATTTYAEDGKRKSVVSFFDGTLRSRQTVTKDNETQTTIVAETFYDYQGRPAINVLPAPTLNTMISFAHNFNRFVQPGYPKDIYDKVPDDSALCLIQAKPLDSISGSSKYYSANNDLVNSGIHQYIPSAHGFPYTETVYTADGTGRIAAQGGVGPVFQINKILPGEKTSKETRYYYGSAEQQELDALFGTEVGYSEHYFKNMVRDANGQYSVSYTDMKGRTIATALAGMRPDNVDSVDFTPKFMTRNLLTAGNNIVKDNSIVSSSSFLVTKAGTHTFHYELGPKSADIVACNPPAQPVCYSCHYNLEIRIIGACLTEPLVFTKKNFSLPYDTDCDSVLGLSLDFPVELEEGEYNVTKTLSLDKTAQQWYRDNVYINTLCKTLQTYFDEQYAVMIANSDCNGANYNCDTCTARLGSKADFRTAFLTSQNITDPELIAELEDEIERAFNEADAACKAICNPVTTENKLEFIRQMMLEDMVPGRGQYALLNEDIDGDGRFDKRFSVQSGEAVTVIAGAGPGQIRFENNTGRLYNIFNPDRNTLVIPYAAPRDPATGVVGKYQNADGSNDQTLTPNPPTGTNDEAFNQFASEFKEEWAKNLLFYHPEYPRLKYATDHLSASYERDGLLLAEETWSGAQTKNYLTQLMSADPFFSGTEGAKYDPELGMTYTQKMNQSLTVQYGNSGKTLWQLAWIAGNCADPSSSACADQAPVGPPFTLPGDCATDKNRTWQIFRNMFLAEKESLVNKYLNRNAPIEYTKITNENYQRRFGDVLNMGNIDLPTGVADIANGNTNNTAGVADEVNEQMQPYFAATCDGYINMWRYKLSTCTELAGRKYVTDQIIAALRQICIDGSDENHMMGSSSVGPKPISPYKSFEEAIRTILGEAGISISSICHPYLIDEPKPYDAQPPLANDVVVEKKDECLCTRLDELKAEKAQAGYTGSLSHYLQYQYNVTISQGKLDTLIAGCSGADDCIFYEPAIDIPGILSCGVTSNAVCIDCQLYANLKTEFDSLHPGLGVIWENPGEDTAKLANNMMFQQFMNARTGIGKTWGDYLIFQQTCAAYDSSWSCNQLDSIVRAYHLAYPDTTYGTACQTRFVTFFNTAFSTAFSYTQIQSLFMQHCGRVPDVCQVELTCAGFGQVIDSFYVRYGSNVNLNGNCKTLFEGHFNAWFGTDYTYAELQQVYKSLCGGVLNVCGVGFDCGKLQAVLDSWKGCHRADQLNNDCQGTWVTYFNGMMSTGLNAMQIDSIYQACNILLDPCQPPVTCKMLTSLLTSYQNGGAASCQGSGLDSTSVNFCNNCFVWMVNDRLGTSYSLPQVKTLYKAVCGTDLQLCDSVMDCTRLTAFVNTYLSGRSSVVTNCDSTFTSQFNLNFHTTYSYNQIMALYLRYCGKKPLICLVETPVTCSKLQQVYFDFKKLYLMPSTLLGDSCQVAFTRYYNQYFGDTLSWSTIQANYIMLCGINLDVCAPPPAIPPVNDPADPCSQITQFKAKYGVEMSNVVMPKQACIDVYSRMFNKTFASRGTYSWEQIQTMVSRCGGEPPLVCDSSTELNAARILDARKGFRAYYYDGISGDAAQVFTEFFNLYYRTSFTNYEQFSQWAKDNFDVDLNLTAGSSGTKQLQSMRLRTPAASLPPAPTNMPPKLCGLSTLVPSIVEVPEDPCAFVSQMALNAATEEYNNYVTQQRDIFDSSYQAQCLGVASSEVFTMRSEVAEYHYTLYYYDQAGNLVKTVPPAGVKYADGMAEPDDWFALVKASRAAGTERKIEHRLPTQYKYNTLNQVVMQITPDAGISYFWYDRLGRLAVSQNAKQAGSSTGKYSYTQYDELGRITEVGQISAAQGLLQSTTQNQSLLDAWFLSNTATREQITKTVYDVSGGLCTDPHILCQTHLRNRVSYMYVQPTASFTENGRPYHNATYYSYDIHGNVDTLLQHYNFGVMRNATGNAFKRMVYKYDLISGKVNEVQYQPGITDQFFHKYRYDAENRLTEVLTSRDSIFWERQAAYAYYKHGPLARTVLGELQVQGLDYAYTLQGWLKGVNGNTTLRDMGDGTGSGLDAQDAYGFSLNYYSGDYKAIRSIRHPFITLGNGLPDLHLDADPVVTGRNLYNGNIASMMVNIPKLGDSRLYGYRYDQLNRLKAMNAYTGLDAENNTFAPVSTGEYKERIRYDGNGNIDYYLRNGIAGNLVMDSMFYSYKPNTNQLDRVRDEASSTYTEDIKQGQATGTYQYDAIGNLTQDRSEELVDPTDLTKPMIEWNVYGKISRITKKKISGTTVIDYVYDANGNRVGKKVDNGGGNIAETWYVRDATGNTMGVYEKKPGSNNGYLSQTELYLYGSSRLGVWKPARDVEESGTWSSYQRTNLKSGVSTQYLRELWERGDQQFELTNHLGNVLVTVSDRNHQLQDIIGHQVPAGVSGYLADVSSASDYYPFGMMMPGRNVGDYRYAFNGKENDEDMGIDSYDFSARIYDGRLGRFLSVDPKALKFPWLSPYSGLDNDPLNKIDPDGESGEPVIDKNKKTITVYSNMIFYSSNLTVKKSDAERVAKNIQKNWNSANGKVTIDGETYSVKFSISVQYKVINNSMVAPIANLLDGGITTDRAMKAEIEANTDIRNNYFRIESVTDGKNTHITTSYADGAGSNTGFLVISQIGGESKTGAHEYGHTIGLQHLTDANGQPTALTGDPSIMATANNPADPKYLEKTVSKGFSKQYLDVNKRKVTQQDINNLGLDKLQYDENGKAKLGKLTNVYHTK